MRCDPFWPQRFWLNRSATAVEVPARTVVAVIAAAAPDTALVNIPVAIIWTAMRSVCGNRADHAKGDQIGRTGACTYEMNGHVCDPFRAAK